MADAAAEIMLEFARETGLEPAASAPQRYLWTDAFAVCNFLELHRRTGKPEYRRLALDLVAQVHRVLGRYRPGDARTGWISGLDEAHGSLHPTAGGLRIGKGLPERGAGEPFDEQLEWDRDGQYFHYLTKWMYALGRAGAVTGQPQLVRWAVELAKKAHAAFVYARPGAPMKRMYWKMSTDLSYPLVPSMGQHDPLDGFITYRVLQVTALALHVDGAPDLDAEIADLHDMCGATELRTADMLGLGGLLTDAGRVAALIARGQDDLEDLLAALLHASLDGLETVIASRLLEYPATRRLAFRELGLAIGLQSVAKIAGVLQQQPERFDDPGTLLALVRELTRYVSIAGKIERFWLDPANQAAPAWREHKDINGVMLATSCAADIYLEI